MYEVIYDEYFKHNEILTTGFLKNCKKHHNTMLNIPKEIKKESNYIALEQGFFSQVVEIKCCMMESE